MSEETTQPSESTAESENTEVATEATTVDGEGNTQSKTAYLDGKYNSVSDLENGYKELQSAFSKKTAEYNENLKNYAQTQAPESYELKEGLESNDKIEALKQFGKDKNFSNDLFNELIEFENNYIQDNTNRYIAQQKDLLGSDADARLKNLQDWGRANLGEKGEDIMRGFINSAESVEAMEKIIKLTQGTSQAVAPAQPSITSEDVDRMRKAVDEYGNRKMSNPAYAAKVRKLAEQLHGSR